MQLSMLLIITISIRSCFKVSASWKKWVNFERLNLENVL